MSWMDARMAQQREIAARKRLISEHAAATFEALWEKLKEQIAEAKSRDFPIFTNGSPQIRTVGIPVSPAAGETSRSADSFTLSLDKAEGCILASGDRGVDFRFHLDVCPDNVVCLKWQGAPISIDDAAVKLLDRFLFPDLA